MALAKITEVTGTAVSVPGDDIDTDRIIPARFMKCVTFDGLGPYAFYDERKDQDGKEKDHPFNQEPFSKAPILLSGSNFGCGSSREHAPQSLYHWGIRAIVAESFAEIFFGNSTTLGIPCVCATREQIAEMAAALAADNQLVFTIDVAGSQVRAGDQSWSVTIADGARQALTEGRWDAIGELLENGARVAEVATALQYA